MWCVPVQAKRRGIEVVITRRSWKPFVRKGTWVRIPPSPLMTQVIIYSWLISYRMIRKDCLGEVPKWLKGHPWKGCRSLIAARGFKSLLLRLVIPDNYQFSMVIMNNLWKCPDIRTLTNKQQCNPENSLRIFREHGLIKRPTQKTVNCRKWIFAFGKSSCKIHRKMCLSKQRLK